jgi:hypothetical protein
MGAAWNSKYGWRFVQQRFQFIDHLRLQHMFDVISVSINP